MTNKETIDIIKTAIAQIKWDYPMDYATAFDKAIRALKTQEPKLVPDIAEAMLGYRPKVKVGHCPSCGVLMSEADKFCRKCGQAVKWE